MMQIFRWKDLSITARLLIIFVLPGTLTFVAVVLHLYCARYAEVQEELDERGHLVATTLAESAQYGVLFANLPYVERTIRGLLQVDKNISRVEVLNADRQLLTYVPGDESLHHQNRIFEAPITRQLIGVNSFHESGRPHVSDPEDPISVNHAKDIVGYVRVAMFPTRMLAKQRDRLLVSSVIVGAVFFGTAILGLFLALGLTRPLVKVIAAVRQIRGGNYQVQMNVDASGEVADLQSAIIEMAGSLHQFREDLEGKVAARTRELEVARDEAIKSNAEKLRLIQKVNSAVEEERKLISVEIHDQLNATLIGIRLQSHQILHVLENEVPTPHSEVIKNKAHEIINAASDLYKTTRAMVRRLRPEIIDALGLCGAVEEMVQNYDSLHPQCRFSFEEAGDFSELADDLAIAAYRLIQESLSNVVKHAAAKTVSVIIQSLIKDKQRLLKIRISDDGKGFDPKTTELGIGLIGMRERVHSFDGQLRIHSMLGEGTTITIEFPFHEGRK